MKNPVIGRNILLVWAAFGLLQFLIYITVYKLPWALSLFDAFLFSGLIPILVRAIWPVCLFNTFTTATYVRSSIIHALALLLLIGTWLSLSHLLFNFVAIKGNFKVYLQFLETYLPIRWMLAIQFYLLLASIFYIQIFTKEHQKSHLKQIELEADLKEMQLNFLKSQLNPHFIFNALNSISSLTLMDAEKAQKMVLELSDFLRYSLRPEKKLVSFQEELTALNKYLAIEKIRFGEKLELSEQIGPDSLSWLIPPFILQPLIENAIKYGVYDALEKNKVFIGAQVLNNRLAVNISNGIESVSSTKKGTGLGLKNVLQRMKNTYNIEGLVQVKKSEKQFTVVLNFPAHENIINR